MLRPMKYLCAKRLFYQTILGLLVLFDHSTLQSRSCRNRCIGFIYTVTRDLETNLIRGEISNREKLRGLKWVEEATGISRK